MLVDDNLCKYENKELEAIAQNPDSDGGYMKACLHAGVATERLPDGDKVRASAALQIRARFLAFAAVKLDANHDIICGDLFDRVGMILAITSEQVHATVSTLLRTCVGPCRRHVDMMIGSPTR